MDENLLILALNLKRGTFVIHYSLDHLRSSNDPRFYIMSFAKHKNGASSNDIDVYCHHPNIFATMDFNKVEPFY